MTIPTTSWDETNPAGSTNIALGDNRIREMKTQIREVMEVDHEFASSGQSATAGQHKQVTLQEQADLGTGAVGATILGSQTISGKGELVYTDEDDNDIQLTDGGDIKVSTSILNAIYPIGIVITLGVATSPNTLLGIGTWSAIEGKVIVGKASSGTFDTLDATGGAETHTLITDEIPAHTHTYTAVLGTGDPGGTGGSGSSLNTGLTTGSTGGGSAHENMPPYQVKYVWQRTA